MEIKELVNEIIELVYQVESKCVDHSENEFGEWVTMGVIYEIWGELVFKIEELERTICSKEE